MGVFNRRRYIYIYTSTVPPYSGKKCRFYVIAIKSKSHIRLCCTRSVCKLHTRLFGCSVDFIQNLSYELCNEFMKPTGFQFAFILTFSVDFRHFHTFLKSQSKLNYCNPKSRSQTLVRSKPSRKHEKRKLAQKHKCRSHFSRGLHVYIFIFA